MNWGWGYGWVELRTWGHNRWCCQSQVCRCAIQATSRQLGLVQWCQKGVSEESGHNKVQTGRVVSSWGGRQSAQGQLAQGTSMGEWCQWGYMQKKEAVSGCKDGRVQLRQGQ